MEIGMCDKIMINRLMIETTRKCQLECQHCLRGDSENAEMQTGYMMELLKNVDCIDTVTFTGGEPFLAPRVIDNFIGICETYNIEVGSFFIATNGILHETRTSLGNEGLLAIINLYTLCNNNDVSGIRISNTKYHGNNTTDNNSLLIFEFTHYDGADWTPESLIAEGRGAGIWGVSRTEHNEINWDYPEEVDVYLNCDGKVLWNCNLSYETQRIAGISIEQAIPLLHKINKTRLEECM
jgi:hypothetical protein